MDIPQQKQQFRDAITQRLARMNEQERQAESRSVCRRILQELPKDAVIAGVYYPMKSEVDILPLITTLLERGSKLYMSRADGTGFKFHQVTALNALKMGPFRIPEPPADAPLLDKTTLQYILVPGMAFDRAGNRLGRGSGGYDKWLLGLRKINPTVQVWGIGFDAQIVHEVPVAAHDQPMDKVIGPRGTIVRAI